VQRLSSFSPVDPPTLSDDRLRVRRDHLVDEIRRLNRGRPGSHFALAWLHHPRRRRAFAVLAVAGIFVGAGAAFAVAKLDAFGGPAAPTPEGAPVVVASGPDWRLVAWPSADGVCLSIKLSHNQGATGCGFPVAGAIKGASARGEVRSIAGLVLTGADLSSGFSAGLVSEAVARVYAKFGDGTSGPVEIYRAPSELRTPAKIFVTQFDRDDKLLSLSALSADGGLAGRWVVP
jgi:hypothetical protein